MSDPVKDLPMAAALVERAARGDLSVYSDLFALYDHFRNNGLDLVEVLRGLDAKVLDSQGERGKWSEVLNVLEAAIVRLREQADVVTTATVAQGVARCDAYFSHTTKRTDELLAVLAAQANRTPTPILIHVPRMNWLSVVLAFAAGVAATAAGFMLR